MLAFQDSSPRRPASQNRCPEKRGQVTTSIAHAGDTSKAASPTAEDPANDRLSISVGSDGRFSEGAYPDSDTDRYSLLYGWPNTGTSFTTIRVDGQDATFGSSDGALTAGPTNTSETTSQTSWTSGQVSVTQTLQLVPNPATGQVDTAKISYSIHNDDSVAHDVGTRVMLDTDVNGNDGASFHVPGIGAVTTEQDLSGNAIPDDFQVFANLSDAQHIASATLRGSNATSPDRLVIGRWPGLVNTTWDYQTSPSTPITSDSAYAVFWNPSSLGAGATRTYSTLYGLGSESVDLTPPLALGVSGPSSLQAAGAGYSPNPFTVTASVGDDGDATANDVRLTLNLPAGLSTTDPTTRSAGALTPGAPEQFVSWSVSAAPRANQADLTYSVTASASNAASKTVQRRVTVPAADIRPNLGNYVALGDSYSSGEGNNPFDAGTATNRDTCHRSSAAWPRILGVTRTNHFACSGAKVIDMYESEQGAPDNQSQLYRLLADEQSLERRHQVINTVTITIGGNDLGFSAIVGDCFVRECLAHIDQNLRQADALKERFVTLIRVIHRFAPHATIYFVGYPRLFPQTQSGNQTCGWLTPTERARTVQLGERLDSVQAAAAQQAGARFISVQNATTGHELCTSDSWFFPVNPLRYGRDQRQAHPVAPGQQSIANTVAAAIRSQH